MHSWTSMNSAFHKSACGFDTGTSLCRHPSGERCSSKSSGQMICQLQVTWTRAPMRLPVFVRFCRFLVLHLSLPFVVRQYYHRDYGYTSKWLIYLNRVVPAFFTLLIISLANVPPAATINAVYFSFRHRALFVVGLP